MKENNNLSRVARNSKKEKTTIEPKTEEINIEPKKKNPLKKILVTLFIIGLLILLWARFIGTMGLIVKEYGITSSKLPDSFDGLKVVHISDIHYGTIINQKRLENIVNEINKIKPDIVVFTGDLYDESINMTDTLQSEVINTLNKLEVTIGKYAVSGNHDYSDTIFEDLITKSGFTYLSNESKIIYNNGPTPIEIVGYPDSRKDNPDYTISLTDYYKIAIIHEPDELDNIKDKGFDLVLSGHSHGGQVRLPIIGKIITPPGSKKYYDEYYNVNDTKMYVSYGLGTSLLRLRLFDHPSFNLYRIYSE